MKSLIVSLLVLCVSATAFGNENDPRVEKAFAKQFTGAENVKWIKLEDGYRKATFIMNGTRAEAYYDVNAQFLGTARNIFYSQLPLPVMQTINNKFAGAVNISVLEISNHDGIKYVVVIELKDKRYQLKLDSIGSLLDKEKVKIQ